MLQRINNFEMQSCNSGVKTDINSQSRRKYAKWVALYGFAGIKSNSESKYF